MGNEGRHPALTRLDPLVGRWTVQPKVAGVGAAWTEFAWQDDGLFLHQVADADPMPDTAPQAWREHAPFPTTAVIGLDDTADEFTMLYADARGVHRVYRMTLADGEWTVWRYAPGFDQRFTGRFSADGDTIEARWEMSQDGLTWNLDFELTYTRQG
jgi:hypothetical protein